MSTVDSLSTIERLNFALKGLKPELVGGERFLAEIKTTANLRHPHILPLYDSGETTSEDGKRTVGRAVRVDR